MNSRADISVVAEFFNKLVEDAPFKMLISSVLLLSTWLLPQGEDPRLYLAIIILIILDTITGLMKAWINKSVSSAKFFRSALKFFVYMILIVAGALTDKIIYDVISMVIFLPIIKSFLAVTETISIVENLAVLGFPLPNRLINKLKDLQKEHMESKE